nr:hypothetical protein [Actinomycetota bacterium]
DYHSLLVDPADSQRLTLGTHNGLYVSEDGGNRWRFAALRADDAMNLTRFGPNQLWVAGHNVLKKSTDGGRTWSDVQASGLPDFDVHALAADPRATDTLFAAVAGQGLYRSSDGGRSFSLVSRAVGGGVVTLAVTENGRILAGDVDRGLLVTADGGAHWRVSARGQVFGLAVSGSDPRRLIAAGAGLAVSIDGGRTWRWRLSLPGGAGPVAWAPSAPNTAFAVAFNGTLFRSDDGGASWQQVSGRRVA